MTAPCTRSSLAFAYFLRVGRYGHAADTLSELSEYFVNVRDGLGLPSSRMPKGYVYRRGDKGPFAHISYNGRVWAGLGDVADDAILLRDNCATSRGNP